MDGDSLLFPINPAMLNVKIAVPICQLRELA
jgi:hypothetical protein